MSLANLRSNYHVGDIEKSYKKPIKPNGVRVKIVLGELYIRPLFVIVEMYDHKKYGKGKRDYLSQFSNSERRIISTWYGKLYDYYLRSGIPFDGVEVSMSEYELLQRAENFFSALT